MQLTCVWLRDGEILVVRTETTRYSDEVLERVLDRGIILDGMSQLAALASHSTVRAEAVLDNAPQRSTPMSLLCPPRQHDRE